MTPRRFSARLLAARDECRNVRSFRFAVPEDFGFVPGMWVMLAFADDSAAWRAYSISSSPLERGAVELTAARVGEFTSRLFDLAPGQTIEMKGPYGRWVYSEQTPHAVLVSGGTGITPFRSMARYVVDKRLPNRLSLFYSCRTPDDMLYREELERLAEAGLKVYVSVTRPEEAAGWGARPDAST